MSDRYVIRMQYERKGLRHTQFILISAENLEDAELLMSEIPSKGVVVGTQDEMDMHAEGARKRFGATERQR